jgi:hypothetical protein
VKGRANKDARFVRNMLGIAPDATLRKMEIGLER